MSAKKWKFEFLVENWSDSSAGLMKHEIPPKIFQNRIFSLKYANDRLLCSGWTGSPVSKLFMLSFWRFFSRSRCSCSMFRLRKLPYTISNIEIRHVDTRDESITLYAHWYSRNSVVVPAAALWDISSHR